jgi:hypothetical protein
MKFEIPRPLTAEHEELHNMLHKATTEPDELGDAVKSRPGWHDAANAVRASRGRGGAYRFGRGSVLRAVRLRAAGDMARPRHRGRGAEALMSLCILYGIQWIATDAGVLARS